MDRDTRLWWAGFALVVGVVVLAVGWVVVTGLLARSRLHEARSATAALERAVRDGDTRHVDGLRDEVVRDAGSAHQLTSGPAWWVAANLPGIGSPLATTRAVARSSDVLARGSVVPLVRVIDSLDRSRPPSASSRPLVDLAALRSAGPSLRSAADAAEHAAAQLDTVGGSWLGPVSSARAAVLRSADRAVRDLTGARRGLATALPMAGADGPRRYFVGFLNEAESRGVGGIPGAYAIVDVDDGHVRLQSVGSDDDFRHVHAAVRLDPQFTALYGQDDPTAVFQNTDVSPSFPDAARLWAGYWAARSGQHVDGAIAVDPSAIGYLLAVTGPAHLADGTAITSSDITALTQQKQYALYPGTTLHDQLERKDFLARVAGAVAVRLFRPPSAVRLLSPLRQAVHERRIVVWSARPDEERELIEAGLAGTLDPGRGPYTGFALVNGTGGKVDFYRHASITYRRASCAAGATATSTLTVGNNVPDYALPPYVLTVLGGEPAGSAPGFDRYVVSSFSTPGSTITSVQVDGRPVHAEIVAEDGLPSARLLLDLPARATRTVTVTTVEPRATSPVRFLLQPSVYTIRSIAHTPNCALERSSG